MMCCKCGDCCTRFEIPTIGKPAGMRCWNLQDDNSCTIYNNRPIECRNHDYPQAICPIGLAIKGKPTGKCMNCGNAIYDESSFCSKICMSNFL